MGEAQQLCRGPGAQDARPGQDDRPIRRGQHLDDGTNLLVRRSGRCRPSALEPCFFGHRFIEQVLRQGQEDRAGTAAQGPADRLGHRGRDIFDRVRFSRPFCETAQGGHLVDLLERLATKEWTVHLTNDREHRRRILACRVDADGEIRAANRSSAEAHRGPAGQLAMGLRHERRRTLVAGCDDPDPGTLEGVEQPEERFAGDGECVADAGRTEGAGNEAPDGSWAILRRRHRLGRGLSRIGRGRGRWLSGIGRGRWLRRRHQLGRDRLNLDWRVGRWSFGGRCSVELAHGGGAPLVIRGPGGI